MIRRTSLALCLSILVCCSPKVSEREFPKVQVPSIIQDPEERMEYAAFHFFDGFADTVRAFVCDSVHFAGVRAEAFEKEFSSWMMLLNYVPRQHAYASIARAYQKSGPAHDGFIRNCEKYMYDPNSPMRDEDFYGVVAGLRVIDPKTPSGLLEGLKNDAGLCALNRVGTPAADFVFTDRYGKMHTLYEVQADLTVLVFSNPGCHACKEIGEAFENSQKLRVCASSGLVRIVNIYPDEDLEAWLEYLPNYPSEWICGHGNGDELRSGILYSLRAIPSIYLLDEHKCVILKDCPTDRLIQYMEAL